jgi:hypothetical protein
MPGNRCAVFSDLHRFTTTNCFKSVYWVQIFQLNHREFKILPLAKFSIKARVLSRKRYYFGRAAKLVSVDLALGWGPCLMRVY